MSSTQTRYYLYSKSALERSGVAKPLKNEATREAAREYKRSAANPSNLGIMDRWSGESVR